MYVLNSITQLMTDISDSDHGRVEGLSNTEVLVLLFWVVILLFVVVVLSSRRVRRLLYHATQMEQVDQLHYAYPLHMASYRAQKSISPGISERAVQLLVREVGVVWTVVNRHSYLRVPDHLLLRQSSVPSNHTARTLLLGNPIHDAQHPHSFLPHLSFSHLSNLHPQTHNPTPLMHLRHKIPTPFLHSLLQHQNLALHLHNRQKGRNHTPRISIAFWTTKQYIDLLVPFLGHGFCC
ncbi:hypothetical protein AUEXF2481DRAFT_203990 [Aureobasidium subglaciale EXF-2481]|uniref:Uncharacterized protein n=1 Tax=Aureobasidium subglaciale (strain EXF-2481) TaxID=1043005 RepID=A0A074YQ52_AURSE|nr:uncharacterized protein AUEXF2481DRAFT_203990 [Aureobasidium subglaciale EXF-2481]KEQ99918.1 hypothetical protein AUEXF2481DRAFT_203990 [Aureobasidium subglaciale EXF-2481]